MTDPLLKDFRFEMLDLGLDGCHVQLLLLLLILHSLSFPQFGQSPSLGKQVLDLHGMDKHLPLFELFLQLLVGCLVGMQLILERFLPILQHELSSFKFSRIILIPLLQL